MSAVQPLLKGEVSRRDGGVKKGIKEALAEYKKSDAWEDVCMKRAGEFWLNHYRYYAPFFFVIASEAKQSLLYMDYRLLRRLCSSQ